MLKILQIICDVVGELGLKTDYEDELFEICGVGVALMTKKIAFCQTTAIHIIHKIVCLVKFW